MDEVSEVDLGTRHLSSATEVRDDNFIAPRPLSFCCRNALQADADRCQEPVDALHAGGGGGGVCQHDAAATGSATATPPAPTAAPSASSAATTAAAAAAPSTTASPAFADEPESGVGDRGEQVGPRGASAGDGGHAQDDRAQAEEDLGHLEGRKDKRGKERRKVAHRREGQNCNSFFLSSIDPSIYLCGGDCIAGAVHAPNSRMRLVPLTRTHTRQAGGARGEAASLCGIGSRGLFPDKFI